MELARIFSCSVMADFIARCIKRNRAHYIDTAAVSPGNFWVLDFFKICIYIGIKGNHIYMKRMKAGGRIRFII
jgi:hypothetical protein